MANSSSSKSKSSAPRKRAVPPSEKGTRKKLGEREAAAQQSQLIDGETRRNLIAIGCAIAALALILIVAWPTNAVVTTFLSTLLREGLGVGAYVLPVLLVVIAATFVAKFETERVPTRVILGLALIFVGLLVLMALFTPGGVGEQGPTSELFSSEQVMHHGGYVGAGPAYLGLMLLGLPVSVVITIGVIIAGLAIIGFSFQKIFDVVERRRAEAERRENELAVAPDSPFVPIAQVESSRSAKRERVNSSARTQALATEAEEPRRARRSRSTDEADLESLDTQLLDAPAPNRAGRRKAAEAVDASGDRALTRKLGSRKDDETKGDRKDKASKEAPAPETAPIDDGSFKLPSMSLLKTSREKRKSKALEAELSETAQNLQQTMEDFGIMAQVVDWVAGPTVTLFEVDLPPGVRVSRITALQDDIALALAAPGVRIFAPIPGTHYVGIEVPNATRENVLLGDVLKDVQGGPLELAIGKDVEGNAIICDLAKMPHLLIGGTTGSGKSVGINAMIMSMLMRATPSEVRFIMIDPKRVEFAPYDGIPHLYVPVVTEPKEAASALSWGVAEMERRLKLFSKVGVRNIGTYNEKVRKEAQEREAQGAQDAASDGENATPLPYIVIIIDELADLMMNVGKEVEFSISRIAQLARAAGIHLIVATQRPSANVVTGLIKANITNRMAFNVASGLDSRVVLDTSGAESLIGNGDLLLSKPEYAKPVRIQGCYTSDEEIAAVVEAVKSQGEPDYHSEILKTNLITLGDSAPDGSGGSGGSDDPLLWEAAEIVVASGLGSTSNIQRKLKVGYSRAGRIMDMLEEKGVVGPPNGSKPREVLVDAMELETLKAFEASDEQ